MPSASREPAALPGTPVRCLAEFIGTFGLVFFGVGSIYADAASGGKLGLTGIALANGLAIMTMVYAFKDLSGANFNPAVTVPLWLTKHLSAREALGYIAAQLLASIAAAGLLRTIFQPFHLPASIGVCSAPGIPPMEAIMIEAILTFFLVSVIWGAAVQPKAPQSAAGLAIGGFVATGILFSGPLTGAAMNPARALGPALVNGYWLSHGIYWLGPLLGGILAGLLFHRTLHQVLGQPHSSPKNG